MSQLRWAGLVEKMGEERMAKRADARRLEGKGGEEELDCDGKTMEKEILKDWEKGGKRERTIWWRELCRISERNLKKIRHRASESRPVSSLTDRDI